MNKKVIVLALILTGAVGGGVYLMSIRPGAAPPPVVPPRMAQPEVKKAPPPITVNLEGSDDAVRDRIKGLSTDSKLAKWAQSDNLIRRITAAMAIIADGNSPRDSLGFLNTGKRFSIMSKGERTYLNPKSYERYDALGAAFESVDAAGTAKLFKELKPLFQQAYEELGYSNKDVQDVLVRAVKSLLDTPVVVGKIRLRKKIISYAMMDNHLEKLTSAQKHLIRMGPENTTKIQNKLREIVLALGIPEDQLPKSQTYNPEVK